MHKFETTNVRRHFGASEAVWTSGDAAASFDRLRSLASGDAAASPAGTKYDEEKPRVDLLDPLALEGVARVLTFGASKYDAHNWRGGIAYSRLLAALFRHLLAILKGEDVDPESGLPHIDHLGCCWMFLSNLMKTRPDLDDRYRG